MLNEANNIKLNMVDVRGGNKERADVEFISHDTIEMVRKFHEKFDEYSVTPLHTLKNLAEYHGLKNIYLKDESYRFGLNAFKVLGGSYAIGKYLAERLNKNLEDISFEYLKSEDAKKELGEITFVTATDGNHGRGVAWAASQLGQKSVVYMPYGSTQSRVDAIRNEGAEVEVIYGNYDEAVRKADDMAKNNGWVVIQDTAWEGYEDIPLWIMQGYGTLIHEAMEQLEEIGEMPTHVFLQAGVGSYAGAVQGYLTSRFGDERPITIVVEPDDANCLYRSSISGKREIVTGHLNTLMAGLACGEPNTISFDVLKDYTDGYISCPDFVSARGVRVMAAPLKGDPQIVSGESGAVGIGLTTLVALREEYKDIKEAIKLNEDSVVLVISTEGDTDPIKYREIVWDGIYPSL